MAGEGPGSRDPLARLRERAVPAGDLGEALGAAGTVFRAFTGQDSGCVGYGVELGDRRVFMKGARTPAGAASLDRAIALHAAVRHPAIVPLLGTAELAAGRVLAFPWAEGEVLYHPAEPAAGDRARAASWPPKS